MQAASNPIPPRPLAPQDPSPKTPSLPRSAAAISTSTAPKPLPAVLTTVIPALATTVIPALCRGYLDANSTQPPRPPPHHSRHPLFPSLPPPSGNLPRAASAIPAPPPPSYPRSAAGISTSTAPSPAPLRSVAPNLIWGPNPTPFAAPEVRTARQRPFARGPVPRPANDRRMGPKSSLGRRISEARVAGDGTGLAELRTDR